MRKPVIAGNWKMFKTVSESLAFLDKIIPGCSDIHRVKIIICPTFLSLASMAERVKGTNICLGAQNIYWEKEGAFTGEISSYLLSELGISYVIIGHSERRGYFQETDKWVNNKIKSALNFNLKPIMCVGESLEEREKGLTHKVVKGQLAGGLKDIGLDQVESITFAYEPIWAIGTGCSATSGDAQEVISFIRKWLTENYSEETAQKAPLLYGGSVKPDNTGSLLEEEDIDGALIGGASLKEDSFLEMVQIASRHQG